MLFSVAGRFMEVRLLHPENALSPMLVKPDGRFMELRLLHQ
jgi:hypothetical protein